jgi:hypothetical protein
MPEFKETSSNPEQPASIEFDWHEVETPKPIEPAEPLDETVSLQENSRSANEKVAATLEDCFDRGQIERLQQAVISAKEKTASERGKEFVGSYGDFRLWQLGDDNASPDFIVIIEGQPNCKPAPQFMSAEVNNTASEMKEIDNVKDNILKERGQAIKDSKERIINCLEEVVTDSPVHKFLESLTMQNPSYNNDRPLNNAEKMIREAQAEQEVKKQFGMNPNDSISSDLNAARALQRQNYSLDEEQVRENPTNRASAQSTEPIKHYFTEAVQQLLPDGEWRREIEGKPVEVARVAPGRYSLRTEGSLTNEIPSIGFNDITSHLSESFDLEPTVDKWAGRHILHSALWASCNPEASDDILKFVLEDTPNDLFEGLVRDPDAYTAISKPKNDDVKVYDSMESYRRDVELHASYRSTVEKGATSDHREKHKTAELRKDTNYYGFGFLDSQTIEDKKAETFGSVINYNSDNTTRLIQGVPRNYDLPPAQGNADLVLITKADPALDPRIPGFRLMSHTGDVYEFVKETDDPYRECQVQLPTDERVMLATQYYELGLETLAQDVLFTEHLTVNDLAGFIKRNSEYHTPDQAVKVSDNPTFGDFTNYVVDDKLQVQCTGAAHFLRLSLDGVFGDNSATTTRGLKLGGPGTVNGLLHRQTQFEYNGEAYILDATPARALDTFEAIDVHKQETLEAKLEINFKHVEMYLSNIFKAPDSLQLHTKLASLPDHDPARRTMEVLAGLKTTQEATEYLDYIESLKQAVTIKDPRLKQLGIGNYSPEVLEFLANQIKSYQNLLME